MTALLLWLGGRDAFGEIGVSIGTLTAFVLLIARFFTPLISLGEEWQTVQAALGGAERVFAVLDLHTDRASLSAPTEEPLSAAATTATPGRHWAGRPHMPGPPAIEMREVIFGYTPGQPVLHRVSLHVQAGEHVAVIGRTGAGKSSILSLIAGLYSPWSGHIELAGTNPAALDDDRRRALLGFVPQTLALFSGTIADNITLGDAQLTAEQVQLAARTAGADPFIRALPNGYDTMLSDSGRGSGVQLSAGQRQLLALTRALVTRPAVLLLDEATAVVDGASDAAFRAALHDHVLPTGTAVLTVAHRLATAREADHVIVLAGGQVEEQGEPAALLTTRSRFADLAALEAAGWDWQRGPDSPH